jgi:mono/diheme cytochrome c family protein
MSRAALAVATCGVLAFAAAACGGGGQSADQMALELYQDNCLRCHGSDGQGSIGPTLDEVAIDFPDCAVLEEWVALGSNNWPSETYGARNKPIEGNMPGFAAPLDETEIAAVSAYVLREFGGVEDTSDCAPA